MYVYMHPCIHWSVLQCIAVCGSVEDRCYLVIGACVYVCVYEYMYVNKYNIYIYLWVYLYLYMNISMYIRMCVCIYIYIYWTLQHTATCCSTHTAKHRNMLQHTHCNTPQHAAAHTLNTRLMKRISIGSSNTQQSLQHTASHCNTPHCTAHCNTLHRTATPCDTLQHTATYCNTLHHTATHCDTLQHTATRCNTA